MKFSKRSKYSGAGNTFVFLSPIQDYKLSKNEAIALCKEEATDGLIYLSPSDRADFYMHFFNLDGTQPGLCGNGLRSIKAYLTDQNFSNLSYTVETPSGIYTLQTEDSGLYSVSYPKPLLIKGPIPLIPGYRGFFVDVGIPHVVVEADDINTLNVNKIGRLIRFSNKLAPNGANVNFYANLSGTNYIRTYERGVEEETKACGTGALATALILYLFKKSPLPIPITTKSQEILTHYFEWGSPPKLESLDCIKQIGPACKFL